MAQLIIQHSDQQRSSLNCNKKLNQIAKLKARMLAKESDIFHNVDHTSPNHLLRKNGYVLSKRYPTIGNQVEAIAGGEKNTRTAFEDFLNSEPHRVLLLGKHPYFSQQNDIGVAYFYDKNTPYEHYWVVLFGDTDKPSSETNIDSEFILPPIKK